MTYYVKNRNGIRQQMSEEDQDGWLTPEQLKEQLHKDLEELRKTMEEDE